MAEPHWIGYIGMVTGIIGAITGIAGAIMGYVGYHRSKKLKALELRLELRKAISDIHLDLRQLKQLMHEAERSRNAINAARGIGGGATQKFKNGIISDRARISDLSNRTPKPEYYDKIDEKALEAGLVSVHEIQAEIQILLDKYKEALQSDKEQQKQLHEDHQRLYLSRT